MHEWHEPSSLSTRTFGSFKSGTKKTCWWPCYGAERKPRFQGLFLDRYLDLLAATHDALAGTGVKVLGFGLSPRIGSKWTASGLAAGIARKLCR